jgi:protein O-GlcNAc transferase
MAKSKGKGSRSGQAGDSAPPRPKRPAAPTKPAAGTPKPSARKAKPPSAKKPTAPKPGLAPKPRGKDDPAAPSAAKPTPTVASARPPASARLMVVGAGPMPPQPAAAPPQPAAPPPALEPYPQAVAHFQAGRLAEAEAFCSSTLADKPQDFDAMHLLGVIRLRQGDFARACELVQKAVAIRPGDAQAQQNLGSLLALQGRLDEAATCYSRAIAIDPRQADAHSNLGLLLYNRGQPDAAIACYRRAIEINPGHPEAHNRLALVLIEQKQLTEALAAAKRALELRPGYTEALGHLIVLKQQACDWAELPELEARLDQLTRPALQRGRKSGEQVFLSMVRSADPARNLATARGSAEELQRHVASLQLRFPHERRRGPRSKITLGYVSGDFRNHPLAHLVRGLFRAHDRNRFRVFAYSYGPEDETRYRADIAAGVDQFVDLRNVNAADCARRIYQDNVDILIDLAGHIGGNRMEIAALRPAPLQVSYLGFPGTTGAAFFDYIVVDRTIVPAGEEKFLAEQPIVMPHSYQVNDNAQPISTRTFQRAEFRLPAKGFVFCCFNNTYKIDPPMFDLWMRLLRARPDSVLWLLKSNDLAEANLKREALQRDVAAERLIFSPKLPKDEHLARLALADLALDTRICNGHTTTSDALWAGVPVVALRGRHFASRVAASLLEAVGLPETVTGSMEDYEALALKLSEDEPMRAALRGKLQRQRLVWPLFDTQRFARNLEAGFAEAWSIVAAGEAPRPILVQDGSPAGGTIEAGLTARP